MNTILPTIITDTKFRVLVFMRSTEGSRKVRRMKSMETIHPFNSYDEAEAWGEKLRSDLFYTIFPAYITSEV